jgi:long-subunit fatty acid transport protein
MKKIILLVTILFVASALNAQNSNDALRLSESGILSGARSLGMGNAYTALSNDLSAGFFNPAGFGLIKKLEFDGGINFNSFGTNTTLFGNQKNFSSSSTNLDQFGFVFPVPTMQGSLVFSLGYSQLNDFNRSMKFDGFNPGRNSMIEDLTFSPFKDDNDFIYELGLSYPGKNSMDTTLINGRLNQSGKIVQTGTINSWFFSGSIEVEKDVFLGGTLDIYSGTYKRTSDYWEDNSMNNYPASLQLDPNDSGTKGFKSFYRNTILDWEIAGWDAKLGLLAKLNEFINIGATIRFPKTYTIKEKYSVYGESTFSNAFYSSNPPFEYQSEYDITTPFEFTFGGAYTDRSITLSADIKLIDYTQMKFSSGLDNQTRSDINNEIKDLFRTVLNLNAGAEYIIPNSQVALRAGFMLMPSAYKDDPSEYDKKYVTAGIGFKVTRTLTFDIGYAYGWWKDFGDNYSANISRTYQDITYHKLIATMKYNF